MCQWIGKKGKNLQEISSFFPSNMGLSCFNFPVNQSIEMCQLCGGKWHMNLVMFKFATCKGLPEGNHYEPVVLGCILDMCIYKNIYKHIRRFASIVQQYQSVYYSPPLVIGYTNHVLPQEQGLLTISGKHDRIILLAITNCNYYPIMLTSNIMVIITLLLSRYKYYNRLSGYVRI